MLDGRVDELKPGDEQYAFNHKSVWARMAIVAAGPMANFVFALFALWLMFMIGVPAVKPWWARCVHLHRGDGRGGTRHGDRRRRRRGDR